MALVKGFGSSKVVRVTGLETSGGGRNWILASACRRSIGQALHPLMARLRSESHGFVKAE